VTLDTDQPLRRFIAAYHRAVALACQDHLEKTKARIASLWIDVWTGELDGPIEDEAAFMVAFGDFLEKLGLADGVTVSMKRDKLTVAVEGCCICPGNELLREQNEPTLCPVLSTGLLAAKRVLGRKAVLLGVNWDGLPEGSCEIEYRLARRRPERRFDASGA